MRRSASAIGLAVVLANWALAVEPAAAQPRTVDVVICVDASLRMRPTISVLRAFAPSLIDRVLGAGSFRVGVVAFRTLNGAPRISVAPLSDLRDDVVSAFASLPTDGDDVVVGPLHGALLTALRGPEIGTWRPGAAKIVLLLGRVEPDEGDSSLEDVVAAARDQGTARIFPLLVSGAHRAAAAALSAIAQRTGGFVLTSQAEDDTPGNLVELLSYGLSFTRTDVLTEGVVTEAAGDRIEASVPGSDVAPGADVLVFDRRDRAVVIAIGSVSAVNGQQVAIELRLTYTSTPVRTGSWVRVVPY